MIPRQYGGEGASVLDMVIAQEHLGRGCASTALGAAMLISVLGRAIEINAWPEPVLAEICRELATQGGGINNCVTETELGSISRGGIPSTTAERAEGGWRVSGRKIFVTAAPALRFMVVGLVLPPDAGSPKGYMASAIIRSPAPGLTIETTWKNSLALRTGGNEDVDLRPRLRPRLPRRRTPPHRNRRQRRTPGRKPLGPPPRRRLPRRRPGRA